VRAHRGQALDIYWTSQLSETRLAEWMADSLAPKTLQMYSLETAAIVEGLAEVAAVLARSSEPTRRAAVSQSRVKRS